MSASIVVPVVVWAVLFIGALGTLLYQAWRFDEELADSREEHFSECDEFADLIRLRRARP